MDNSVSRDYFYKFVSDNLTIDFVNFDVIYKEILKQLLELSEDRKCIQNIHLSLNKDLYERLFDIVTLTYGGNANIEDKIMTSRIISLYHWVKLNISYPYQSIRFGN